MRRTNFSKDVIKQIKCYIDDNYCSDLSVDQLSNQFGVYPDFITSNMKKEYQITPKRYWILLRITKSKDLLVNTDMTIAEIAKEVGYKNEQLYWRTFEKVEGLSPIAFRNRVLRK